MNVKSEEWLLKERNDIGIISSAETGEEYQKRKDLERKEALLSKPLHGKFFSTVNNLAEEGYVDLDRSWQWLKGGYLTKSTESYIMAAQEQALQTKWRRSTVEGIDGEDGLCRVCGKRFETIKHVVSGCSELAKKQYLIRHDKMGARIHWELCKKYSIDCAEKWFNHIPSSVCRNADNSIEIYWNRKLLVGKGIEANKPDLIGVDKANQKWTIVDFCVPGG